MRKIYSILLVLCIVSSISFTASAQQKYWSLETEASVTTKDKAVARISFPKQFKLFGLNLPSLKQELFSIVGNQAARRSTVISLPNAAGGIEQFEVYEASNFDPVLQARFPDIRAFSGQGITDRAATLKLSISPQGIQTMVFRTEKENEFIEPYSNDHKVYAVFESRREKGSLPWTCSTPEQDLASDLGSQLPSTGRPNSSTGELKVLRLAQSCNGEYANWFGATSSADVALVMAAFNATMTRCNGVYEKDLAIHLNLIPETVNVIYYTPATDPYSTNLNNWNGQLMNTLHNVIGDAAFDIGHMFGASGGGGNAGCIGCVCSNVLATGVSTNSAEANYKGGGITSPADGVPQGDNFDIDYVVHEVGHQLGANHTYSHLAEGTGVNKEVGSGITIMGYAGITNQDVAPHSIDIYHQASIQQIQVNLAKATKTCPVTTNISAVNATPVVAAVPNYTIPISTPFALTGSATDANVADVLTYCWEQNDNSTTTGNSSVASPTKTTGPNFLSFSPTTSPTRVFPRLSTILNGGLTTGPLPGGDAIATIEALSSVNRTLNFRLTVRDNSPYTSVVPLKVGQTSFTDMTVTVTNTSGPFAITVANSTGVSWAGNSSQTITWDVANTTTAPVSCANVNILLSTDGGQTFPTTLVANTPNDGSQAVTLPNINATTCRLKVESVGNIFFDINNANFAIAVATPSFDFNTPAATNVACAGPATASVTLGVLSFNGYITPVNLAATGNPAGTTVSFTPNPVVPGNNVTVTLNNTNTLANGSYTITVTGTSGLNTATRNLTFNVQTGTGPAISVQPQSQAACVGTTASFSVTATGVLSYQWQQSTDGGANFINIGSANSATYTTPSVTTAMNNYQYRVIITGQCNTTTSAAATLTVRTAPAISAQPASTTLCLGTPASFSVTASGTNITYLWQQSTDGGSNYTPAPGANTGTTYTTAATTTGMNNYRYRVIVSGTCTPAATSTAAVLTVISPVAVTTQPANVTICETGNVSFTVAGSSTQPITYQWQVSTDGGINYINVPGAPNAPTLEVNAVTAGMNNNRYRVLLSNTTCTAPTTSGAAILTVNARPTVTLSAAPYTSLLPGQTTTITAAIQPSAAGFNISWFLNGGQIPGANTTTYSTGVEGIGDYKVAIINPTTGCNNESQVLSITATPSTKLFIFPSPNDGQFKVSYYNSAGINTQQTISIFDMAGKLVYSSKLAVNGQYTIHPINIRGVGRGVYIVVIGDANGKRLAKERVLIH
ncbi:MAG: reprolysin-like metallopeptidase [Chitinophagaceae bacterium]